MTTAVNDTDMDISYTLDVPGGASGAYAFSGVISYNDPVGDPVEAAIDGDTVLGEGVIITTVSLPEGTEGLAYSTTLAATGGVSPYTWSVVAGGLPAGLGLNGATGEISGTPTAAGVSAFTVHVDDSQATSPARKTG